MVQFLSIIFFLGFLQFLLGFSKVPVFFVSPCTTPKRAESSWILTYDKWQQLTKSENFREQHSWKLHPLKVQWTDRRRLTYFHLVPPCSLNGCISQQRQLKDLNTINLFPKMWQLGFLFANWDSPAAPTGVFMCFFVSCKANARVITRKDRARPALFLTSELCCSMYFFGQLCCSVYCLCVTVYCNTATGCQPNCS